MKDLAFILSVVYTLQQPIMSALFNFQKHVLDNDFLKKYLPDPLLHQLNLKSSS